MFRYWKSDKVGMCSDTGKGRGYWKREKVGVCSDTRKGPYVR